MLTASLLAAFALAAHAMGTTVLLPTSEALHLAEDVAQGRGYDLAHHDHYFFDALNGKGGRPFLPGYVTFGFYWDNDTIDTISINETTGLTVDPVSCTIFDYPKLRADRAALSRNRPPPDIMADLKAHTGCDAFKTLSRPERIRR